MSMKPLVRNALGLLIGALSFAATAGGFTSLTVFGDNLSDGGKDYLYTGGVFPSVPYAQRLSNGPVAVEQLAAMHNLDASSLVVLWAGSNDLYSALASGGNPAAAMSNALNNLGMAVLDLYGDGARTILMPNLPDIGLTPWGLGSGNSAMLTGFTAGFNAGLHTAINTWRTLDPDLSILEFDFVGRPRPTCRVP